jgi:hypothetical protein
MKSHLLSVVVWGALGVAGCSSPTALTPSTAVLSISGTTWLTAGLTSQLTATNGTGAVVTAGLTWQSQATNVATVSATGLVTATGVGTTTITTTASGVTGRVPVVVQQPGNVTTTITAYGSLAIPGRYVRSSDLAPAAPCLILSGVAGVQLDCAGHGVGPIVLSNVSTVTINNCAVTGNVAMTNVNSVTVTNSTVVGGLMSVSAGTTRTCSVDLPALTKARFARLGSRSSCWLTGRSRREPNQAAA